MRISSVNGNIFFGGGYIHLSPDKRAEYLKSLAKSDYFYKNPSVLNRRGVTVRDNSNNQVNAEIVERIEDDESRIFRMYNDEGRKIGQILLVELNNPKRLYIQSLSADYANYKGVGTELIKSAIQKSYEMGLNGELSVHAGNLFSGVEYYRKSVSPVPFYYKMGFRCRDERREVLVEKGMADLEKTGYYTGPEQAAMFLDKNAAKNFFCNR